MILYIFLIILGIAIVIESANQLTEGASSLARRMHVSEITIGLTIVAAGTSAPELFVSAVSALKGTPDMAVGNVVGSNIFNTLLIVGISALVAPMAIEKATVKKDMPFTFGASLLLILLCLDSNLSRIDGLILLIAFAIFMAYTLMTAKGSAEVQEQKKPSPLWLNLLSIVGGLVFLIVGADIFVDNAAELAKRLGMSESMVGLTIVAGGTSLPELATSVVAARKGRSAMAIGNVIGSNVFNILFILGTTATISPLLLEGITIVDLSMLVVSVALLWLFSFTKYRVSRWEGAVLTILFLAYMTWLIACA